jgi:hypothetical protein
MNCKYKINPQKSITQFDLGQLLNIDSVPGSLENRLKTDLLLLPNEAEDKRMIIIPLEQHDTQTQFLIRNVSHLNSEKQPQEQEQEQEQVMRLVQQFQEQPQEPQEQVIQLIQEPQEQEPQEQEPQEQKPQEQEYELLAQQQQYLIRQQQDQINTYKREIEMYKSELNQIHKEIKPILKKDKHRIFKRKTVKFNLSSPRLGHSIHLKTHKTHKIKTRKHTPLPRSSPRTSIKYKI